MSQPVRTVENIPEEAAELAEVASRLIEVDPRNRRAFAELAAVLGGGLAGVGVAGLAGPGASTTALAVSSSLPLALAFVARRLGERSQSRPTMMLPGAERQLWEDAGASFEPGAIEQDALN